MDTVADHAATPPRPSGSAIVHTARFLKDPFGLFMDAMEECGSVFALRLLGIGDWVFLCSSDTIRQAYKAPSDVLVAGELSTEMSGFMFGSTATAWLDGDAHQKRQRLLLPHLNGPPVQQYVEAMRSVTEETIARWPLHKSFAFLPHSHRMTLEVIVRAMFGTQDKLKWDRFVDIYDSYSEKAIRSPLLALPFLQIDLGRYSPWGRVLRHRDETRRVFEEEIENRATCPGANGGILGALMNCELDGERLSRETLVDEVMTLLFAGHETTSTSLIWILERVLSHPEVLERIDAELDSVLGGEPVEEDHLSRLKYLGAVINEGLRTGRRIPFTGLRRVKKSFRVGDYVIPAGRIIGISHYAMCHREDTFPQPHRFDPGRFSRNEEQGIEWAPFGRGARACAGKGFALTEIKVILATLFQRARLHLPSPVKAAVREGFMFSPDNGLQVVLEQRS